MLLPSSGSLEPDLLAAVGKDGLAEVHRLCGANFSLTDLQQAIGKMPECPERCTLETVAGIVKKAHQQIIGRMPEADAKIGE